MHLVSCTNTHRDVTDSVNHGMVKNTKIWISWEENVIFLWNKKSLNLCFIWHILRSYRFVVEFTEVQVYWRNSWKKSSENEEESYELEQKGWGNMWVPNRSRQSREEAYLSWGLIH